MRQSTSALGHLVRRYATVLKKCRLLNVFGSLALAATLGLNGTAMAASTEINTSPTWDAANSSGAITLSGGGQNTVDTCSANTNGSLSTINITGPSALTTLNVNNNLTFTGGLTMGNNGALELKNGATMTVDSLTGSGGVIYIGDDTAKGQLVINGGVADFPKYLTLVVYFKAMGPNDVALLGTNGATLNVAAGNPGQVRFAVNAPKTGTFKVTQGFTAGTIAPNAWLGDNLHMGASGTVSGAWSGADYTVTIKLDKAEANFSQLATSMSGLLNNMSDQWGQDVFSPNAGVRFASRALSSDYIGETNPRLAAATLEGAAQAAAVGAVQGSLLSATQAGAGATALRTGFAQPASQGGMALQQNAEGNLALAAGQEFGLAGGDRMNNGLGMWIMPLFKANSVYGMESGSFDTGYTSNLGGVALGADYTFADAFRLGVALNMGGGYAQSNGDFNTSKNNFNFWGVSLYGGWTAGNFGLSADAGYTSTYNRIKQETPAAMQTGDLKADATAHAWSAGLRGEYVLATSVMDIIPHVGVRYTGLTMDGYDVKGGGTVFEVEQDFQNIWTFPVGVTLRKNLECASGWTVTPLVDLGIIPAAGDVKAKSRVSIPGVAGNADLKTQVVDYLTFDGTAGLEVKKDNLAFGVNYNLQASEHRTGHGVFGTFRYEF